MNSRCSDPEERDKLIRSYQALRNYSVQLKILASVNAATSSLDINEKKKEDNQMVVLAQSIGKLLSETIKTVEAAQKTIKI